MSLGGQDAFIGAINQMFAGRAEEANGYVVDPHAAVDELLNTGHRVEGVKAAEKSCC